MSDKSSPSYEVGFGKPPEASRFKPGQSGNPRGRPKGVLNLATTVQKALRERVTVVEHGRRRQVSKLEATVTQLVNRAAKGEPRATQQLLALVATVEGNAATTTSLGKSQSDREVMASILLRLTPGAAVQADPAPGLDDPS